MKTRLALSLVILAALAAVAGLSSIYSLNEGESALIVRLGAPVGVVEKPGLQFKAPFIDTVVIQDARLLLLEPQSEQVILGDQKRLVVQAYTRFRIADPLRFYQSLRTLDEARAQLSQVVNTAMRREFGQIGLRALLSPKRVEIIDRIRADVVAKFRPLGVEVVEVRLHRADLPLETSQAIYDRMKSERQREAKELRAQGFEWAQQIQSRADRERTIMLSQAQRNAQIARGEGDAQASALLAQAEKGDPQFYIFYRSLQSYRQALADSAPVLLLSPDAEFLQALKAGPPPGLGGKPEAAR